MRTELVLEIYRLSMKYEVEERLFTLPYTAQIHQSQRIVYFQSVSVYPLREPSLNHVEIIKL